MTPDPFYGTDRWKKARREALKRSGYRCALCKAGVQGLGMSRVDHIQTKKSRPDLALVQANLRVLCIACDAARHSEKGGVAADRGCDANGNPLSATHHWNKP